MSEFRDSLAAIEHLVVDEAQDVVGPRADLLSEIIAQLPPRTGVTVLTDDAQAIYGFTDEEPVADDVPPDNLPSRIRAGRPGGFRLIDLEVIHRTDRAGLLSLSATLGPTR